MKAFFLTVNFTYHSPRDYREAGTRGHPKRKKKPNAASIYYSGIKTFRVMNEILKL